MPFLNKEEWKRWIDEWCNSRYLDDGTRELWKQEMTRQSEFAQAEQRFDISFSTIYKNNPPTPVDMSRCRAYMDEVLYRPGDKVHFVLKWSSHQGRWQCVAADYKSQQESYPPHSRFNVWTSHENDPDELDGKSS